MGDDFDTNDILEVVMNKGMNRNSDDVIAQIVVEQLNLEVPRFIAVVTLLRYLREESNARFQNVISLVYSKIDSQTLKKLSYKLNK